jgi:hypothetical protein
MADVRNSLLAAFLEPGRCYSVDTTWLIVSCFLFKVWISDDSARANDKSLGTPNAVVLVISNESHATL